MSDALRFRAEELADRSYSVRMARDATTDGREVWFLTVPELPGCMAQGRTLDEAVEELREARVEYIMSLLEDGLPVPSPGPALTATSGSGDGVISYPFPTPSQDDVIKKNERRERNDVGEVAWVA